MESELLVFSVADFPAPNLPTTPKLNGRLLRNSAAFLLVFDLLVTFVVIVVARHLFVLLSKLVQSFGEFHLIGFSDKFRLKNRRE